MDKKETNLEAQDHPLKNTDGAFVQVGKNGEPVMPSVSDEKGRTESQEEGRTANER